MRGEGDAATSWGPDMGDNGPYPGEFSGYQEQLERDMDYHVSDVGLDQIDQIVRHRLTELMRHQDDPNAAQKVWETLSVGFHKVVGLIDEHEEGFLRSLLLIGCLALIILFLCLPCVANRIMDLGKAACRMVCCRPRMQRVPAGANEQWA